MMGVHRNDQKFTGILLAGGLSSRMGREKGLIIWKGKSLAEHAINILAPLCENMIISANSDHYHAFGFPVIRDVFPDCGPMGGIYSALAISGTRKNLVIPSDTPFVTTEIYRYLISFKGSYDVVLPRDHDAYHQPLCAIWSKSVLPFMEGQIKKGILGFTPLLEKVETRVVPLSSELDFYHPNTFFNINSPDDLEALS